MKKTLLALAVVSLFALLPVVAGGASESSAPASKGGTAAAAPKYADQIVVGKLSEPLTLDPNGAGVGGAEVGVTQQVYEGLVTVGPDGNILPVLATDWTISPDGMTYTFNLRQGVKFSDGTPVTSDDWVWSLYRARDYEESSYRFIAEMIDTVEATDSQVVIKLKEPAAPFLYDLANFNMVVGSKKHWESVGDAEFGAQPLGTGPYMLENWNRGESLTLVANPYYWDSRYPKTKRIRYNLISDDNTRLMQLQSGQVDVINDVPYSLLPMIRNNKNLNLDVFESTQIRYLILNTTLEPFNDPAVRRAMYYALNKEELSTLAGGFGKPVVALVSPTEGKWCNLDLPVTTYDPEKSKQMLKEAGYTEPVKFTISVSSGSTFYEQAATLIKSEVDKAGFDCTIELMERASLSAKYRGLQHQCTLLMWIDDIQDPSEVTGWTVDYDQCKAWYTGLVDQPLEDLNAAAFRELDETKRIQMYHEIQQRVYDNANVIPLYSNGFAWAESKKVSGVSVNMFGVYECKNWVKEL